MVLVKIFSEVETQWSIEKSEVFFEYFITTHATTPDIVNLYSKLEYNPLFSNLRPLISKHDYHIHMTIVIGYLILAKIKTKNILKRHFM